MASQDDEEAHSAAILNIVNVDDSEVFDLERLEERGQPEEASDHPLENEIRVVGSNSNPTIDAEDYDAALLATKVQVATELHDSLVETSEKEKKNDEQNNISPNDAAAVGTEATKPLTVREKKDEYRQQRNQGESSQVGAYRIAGPGVGAALSDDFDLPPEAQLQARAGQTQAPSRIHDVENQRASSRTTEPSSSSLERDTEPEQTVVQAHKVDDADLEEEIRNKIVSEAVEAELHEETPTWTSRKICIVVVIVVLVSGLIGGLVGGLAGKDDGDSNAAAPTTEAPSSEPSLAPSDTPSLAPTFSQEAIEILGILQNASPQSVEALENPDSPQYQAYLWLIGPEGGAKEDRSQMLQRFAMATFFYATGGDKGLWTNSDGWLTIASECVWFNKSPQDTLGVESCDLSNNVRSLSLQQNGLMGSIPVEIGLLREVRQLDLSQNSLSGPVPRLELMRMTFVTKIDLSYNSLTGALPIPTMQEYTGELQNRAYNSLLEMRLNDNLLNDTLNAYHIESLSSLNALDLSRNSLRGEWPLEGMNRLSRLQLLSLSELYFSGTIDDLIWNAWKGLQSLNIQNSGLGGTIPEFIGDFSGLRRFDISYSARGKKGNRNNFYGTLPETMANLDLQGFWFGYNEFNGTFPEFFCTQMPNLEFLVGSHNQLSSTIPPSIGNMTAVKNFELMVNDLTGPIPTEIGLLSDSNLREFKVGVNQLTGQMPTELGLLTRLTRMFIHSNSLTGPIPTQIGEMSSLTSFVVHTNNFNSTFPTQIGNLRGLSMIQLMNMEGITGPMPTELGLLTNMARFRVTRVGMEGTLPTEIGNLTKVRQFKLESTQMGGPLPSTLGNMESLTEFSVFNNTFNEAIPNSLAKLSFIREGSFALNSFSGTMPFCGDETKVLDPLVADCSELFNNCSCCTVCCQDGEVCDAPPVAGTY